MRVIAILFQIAVGKDIHNYLNYQELIPKKRG